MIIISVCLKERFSSGLVPPPPQNACIKGRMRVPKKARDKGGVLGPSLGNDFQRKPKTRACKFCNCPNKGVPGEVEQS